MSSDERSSSREAGASRDSTRSRQDGRSVGHPARKPYQAPHLRSYGKVVDLTRMGGSQIVDSGGGLGAQP